MIPCLKLLLAYHSFTCRYIRLLDSHYLPLSKICVFSLPLGRNFFLLRCYQPQQSMKSKYNIFRGALDFVFFHVEFQETEYMISPEQGRVFLKWQLVLPTSFKVLISFTWGYLVPFRLIIEGIRLANTWSYLEGISSLQLGGYAPSTACLLPFALASWREI